MVPDRIHGLAHRDFQVQDAHGTICAEVRFDHWFKPGASGQVNGQRIRFIAAHWSKRGPYRIEVEGAHRGEVTLGWMGTGHVTLLLGSTEWALRCERRGLFRPGLRISTAPDIPLFDLVPRMRWFRAPDYHVEYAGAALLPSEHVPLLLAVTGYCAALVRARQSVAAS
jgi:hypothetical protein